jgi:O-antigen ligase
VLAFGVLTFGAVQEWAVCALECAAALLFVAWAVQKAALGSISVTNSAILPALGLLFIPFLQLATGHTAYAYDTHYTLLEWLAYGVFYLIASEFSGDSLLRMRMAISIAVFGSLYALFAMLQGSLAPANLIYGVIRTQGTGFGSYTNRNHYAGLTAMLLPFGLVVLFSSFAPKALRLLCGFGSLVMLASIFMSGSRGGMFSVMIGLIFLLVQQWRGNMHRGSLRKLILAGVLTAAFVGYFSFDRVASRSVREATDVMRLQIARDSLKLLAAHPLLGSGLGSFPTVYPTVCTIPTNLFVNAAHDDYLQLAVETGLAGVLLAVLFLWLLFRNGLRSLRRTGRSRFSDVTVAALAGCVSILIHSFFDFNLQIPANAAVFAFLAGLASARPD